MKSKFVGNIVLGVGAFLVFASGRLPAQQSSNMLIGTWRLVSWESRSGTAVLSHPFGDKPVGVLTYDAKGRMSAQLMRRDRPAFKSGDLFRGTPDEIKAALEGFLAYFGTYTVDERAKTVTHHVEASSFPNFVGTHLTRTFSFSGNRLTLRTDPWALGGRTETGVLVWERTN